MKATTSKCLAILLFVSAGIGTSVYAQCVNEDDVYTFTYEGHTYEIIKSLKTWADAAACAVERGGYLVEISSQAEQDTVYQSIVNDAGVPSDYTTVFDGGGIAYIWIGATDQNTEGEWLWDGDGDSSGINFWNGQGLAGAGDGAPVEEMFNYWGGSSSGDPNEPDDFGEGQDGAAIALAKWPAGMDFTLGIASEWNDINSENELYFVVEYNCTDTYFQVDIEAACNYYMTPDSVIWTTSGSYFDTIRTAVGCDSVYAEFFNVITVDTSVTRDGNTLTANTPDAAYQWLDCINDNSQIEGETGQSFTPSVMGSFAVEITVNSCKDTSFCYTLDPAVGMVGNFSDRVTALWDYRSDMVFVDLAGEYRDIQVQVFDLQGRIVHNESMLRTREFQFTLEQPPGIYFIYIRSKEFVTTKKIIKQ
jgi:hypothetical protein